MTMGAGNPDQGMDNLAVHRPVLVAEAVEQLLVRARKALWVALGGGADAVGVHEPEAELGEADAFHFNFSQYLKSLILFGEHFR